MVRGGDVLWSVGGQEESGGGGRAYKVIVVSHGIYIGLISSENYCLLFSNQYFN